MAIERIHQMTVEEYIAFDEETDIRHEYIDGEVIAIARGHTLSRPYHGKRQRRAPTAP